jgi:hypothetical protein
MPSARELLEQADALMRRNRGDSGIPVLTDSVPEVVAVPGRGSAAPERTGPAARAQAADAPPSRDNGQQDYRREPEGPPPTGAVESAPRAPPPSQPTMGEPDALATTERSRHEIEPPLLTDAVVDMADAIVALPGATAESDLSLWLGPDTIDPSLHSITGPAPDTVAVVPPVTLRAPDLQPEPAPSSDEPTLQSTGPAPDTVAIVPPVTLRAPDLQPELAPFSVEPALHSITGPAPDTVAVVPPVTLRVHNLQPEPAPFSEDRDPTVTRTLRAAGSAPTPPPKGSAPLVSPEIAAVREAVAAVAVSDDERWHALAEQISMQVLQRLDLFVDTGLKAQLAAHLQPIVVRAGAELVEAITDHVGQLVRTYVAEAIEREITQWRQQNK